MFGKTPVTALEEYCAKKGVEKPTYTFQNSEIGKSFVCQVIVLQEMAEGVGRSKKEAKHDAAANIIQKIRRNFPDIEEIPQAPHETISTTDAIAGLRDLCVQLDYPLPSFEIVQQTGPPEAPEFTAECKVSSIVRYGLASTKKAAKQKAAQQIIDIIRSFDGNRFETQIASLNDVLRKDEETKRARMKTYREYIDADVKVQPGISLSDRHNFFKKFDPDLKKEALKQLNDPSLLTDADRVAKFLEKLQIKMKKSTMPVVEGEDLLFIELVCDFNCSFADTKEKIWPAMITYFKDMLY